MPEKQTVERARKDKAEGKAPSTQAGEFVKQEMDHIRQGKHGARSTKQAIAIGLSEARRAGVQLKPPAPGRSSARTRKQAERDLLKGASGKLRTSAKRARATENALKRESRSAASRSALSKQARGAAKKRSAGSRSAAAKKAARTKGP